MSTTLSGTRSHSKYAQFNEVGQSLWLDYIRRDLVESGKLKEMIAHVDLVAMDMKPASVTGEGNYDLEHRKFLEIAKQKETFIKIIVSTKLLEKEYLDQIHIVRETAPETPVLLVPLSSHIEGHEDPELMKRLILLQRQGARIIRDVRIVPRFHKILKIR